MTERVVVGVRVRPPLRHEGSALVVAPLPSVEEEAGAPQRVRVGDRRVYDFDAVFGPEETAEGIFRAHVAPLIESAATSGLNATCVMYGQTGAGKTHTMHEIMPMAVTALTELVPPERLTFSAVEVYGDGIRDLIAPAAPAKAPPLRLLDGGEGQGTKLLGASVATLATAADAHWIVEFASSHRVTAATRMNPLSSRSHALYTFHVPWEHGVAKLNFVDLAGSERNKRTGNTAQRFKESVGINSELLALGNVIRAVSKGAGHVPYRASKLTRLLQDSLGGNSRTFFLACVAPTKADQDESVRTLQYSALAMKVFNDPLPGIAVTVADGPATADVSLAHDADTTTDREVSLAAALAESRDRVAALERELHGAQRDLRKDEVIFAEKLRAMAVLEHDNRQLRERVESLEAFAQQYMRHAVSDRRSPVSGGGTPPDRPTTDTAHCGTAPTPALPSDGPSPVSPQERLAADTAALAAALETQDVVRVLDTTASSAGETPFPARGDSAALRAANAQLAARNAALHTDPCRW